MFKINLRAFCVIISDEVIVKNQELEYNSYTVFYRKVFILKKFLHIITNRFLVIVLLFTFLFSYIGFKAYDIQVVNGKEYREKAATYASEQPLKAPRGLIKDSKGRVLARNSRSYVLKIAKVYDVEFDMNSMLLNLYKVLKKNGDTMKKSGFDAYLKSANKFGPILKDERYPGKYFFDWYKFDSPVEKIKSVKTPEQFFSAMKEYYKVDGSYAKPSAYKIIELRFQTRDALAMNPIVIAEDISEKSVAEISENSLKFPGISVDVASEREYAKIDYMGQLIGYTGKINEKEYEENKEEGYTVEDYIGKDGIEYSGEKYLKGQDGVEAIEFDNAGKKATRTTKKKSTAGDTVTLTVDMKLQKIAYDSLKNTIASISSGVGGDSKNYGDANAGAIVALDVNTGAVLAMANYPSYSSNIFADTSRTKELNDVLSNASGNKPLLNRAIAEGYAPGSTFKPMTGIAGIETGIVYDGYMVNDIGVKRYDGMPLSCLSYTESNGSNSHGYIDLTKALAVSCNFFFFETGIATGIENVAAWGKKFGLGIQTGIDLRGEISGTIASHEAGTYGEAATAQASIGQESNRFSPLQLATYTATIANGGRRYTPYLIASAGKENKKPSYVHKLKYVDTGVSESTIARIKEGMKDVTSGEEGTAADIFLGLGFTVAGKTGTAETTAEYGVSNNGVFICYAPVDNPQIAVAVVIEHGVWGRLAAPVARDVIKSYFELKN